MKQARIFCSLVIIVAILVGCSGEVVLDCSVTAGMRLSDIPISVTYDDNVLEHTATWYILIDGQRYELSPEDQLGNGQYKLALYCTLPEDNKGSSEEAVVVFNGENGTISQTNVLSDFDRQTTIQFSFHEGNAIPESLKKYVTISSEAATVNTSLADIDLSVLCGSEELEYSAAWYVERDGEWHRLAWNDYLGSGTYELRVRYTLTDILGSENGEGLSVSADCITGIIDRTNIEQGSVCTTVIRFRFEEGRHFCNHAAVASSPLSGTCTEGLSYSGICYKCGEIAVEEIPPQAHVLDKTVAVTEAPTCVAEGLRTGPCRVCGEMLAEIIPATGIHNYWRSKPQTQCPEGVLYYLHCHDCGHNAEERLPPQAHKYRCTTHLDYRVHLWVCSVCMHFYTERHHFDANGRCVDCGYVK